MKKSLNNDLNKKHYNFYILITMLQGTLAGILEEIGQTREIVQEQDMFKQICKRADPSKKSLNQLEDYFKSECSLTPKIIFNVVSKLSLNVEFKAILGKKIILLWIKYKIFEAFDIMKKNNVDERSQISKVIEKYNFEDPKANIDAVIRECIKSIGGDEADLNDLKQMIVEGRTQDINQLFYQEPPSPGPSPILEYNPDKSIEQQLADFIKDYKYLPEGSLEKVLQREQIIAFLAKYPETRDLPVTKPIPELKNEANNISGLQSAYLKEYGVLNTETSKIFKKMTSDETSKEIYENICALKSRIFPINVLQLQRLINKTNDARKLIENKDVLFILGTTGSGKSTNILKFLGYTLKKATFKGLDTLIPVQELLKDHKSFYTSPQAKSCTRYINATPVPQRFYRIGTPANKKTLVICDSPGFGDSAGFQVDIANGVGMINALHGARSVRVVVLLAHDALTADRMKGAIQIGDIISSLFHDISEAVDSIAIYFNKVPKQSIKAVPRMIQSKIENLTETEKANQKLVAFLQLLHQKSEEVSNFIYPLESNYNQLFNLLVKMPVISEVKKNFRYEFSDSTKREINNFVTSEKGKIKDYINNERYTEARFHFKMLEKLKEILFINDKIQEAYSEVAKFVQKESLNEFKRFEQYLIQICNGEDSDKLASNLSISKKKVEVYETNFHDFEQIIPASKDEIINTIQEYKNRLLGEFKNLGSFNSKKIFSAVKIFSRELAPELEKNVVDMMNKQFNQAFRDVSNLLEEKAYLEMGELIKTLKSTAGFIANFSSEHSSKKQMEELKSRFSSQIDQHFEFINENIVKDSNPILQRNVISTREKLSNIEQIESLKIIDDSAAITKKLNECIKSIINRCKTGIRELDSIDMTITSDEKKSVNDNNYLKSLSSKKAEIELLMTISNVGEVLKQDYEYTKENIGRRLAENVEILNNCISALRGNKSHEIDRDVNIIKKSSEIVLKCAQLVDQTENSKKIAESITGEFLNYLNGEMQIIKGIQIRLSQINSDSLQKIERQNKKNETYSKMASIDPLIADTVMKLKEQFNKTLKNPFAEFKAREISYLNEKGHYKYLTFSLQRFQKLCYYSRQIEQIVSIEDYAGISADQKSIQEEMLKYFNKMKQESLRFNQSESHLTQTPQYLRELIKILIALSSKQQTCIYLSRKLQFQVPYEIQNIKKQLVNIKSQIDTKYSQYYQSNNRIEQLMGLVKICRFYVTIEEALKIKQDCEKINFKELEKAISLSYYQNLKGDEERAKSLIQGCQPTKISWSEVKSIYNQFYQLKTPDGTKKRGIITHELRIVEKNILQGLKLFNNEIANNPDLIFVNRQKMNDFLDMFKEAIQIQRQLNSMYVEEDKKLIQISNRPLKEVGSTIIEIFKTQFESVKKQLTDYNITNLKQKINNFGVLQSIVYNVFLQEDLEQNGENTINIEQVQQYIEAKRNVLDQQIKKQQFIDSLQRKNSNQKGAKLKTLFQTLRKGISMEIQSKYDHFSDSFVIDNGFKKYYTNFIHPKDQANNEHQKYLVGNVNLYFTKLYTEYKEKSGISVEQSDKIEKQISTAIQNLPPDLKQGFNESFRKIKSEIKAQNDDMVQDLSQKMAYNPNQIENYLQSSAKAYKNGQKNLHMKFIEKLELIYTQKSRTSALMADKITFINDYFLKVYERSRHILENDPSMLQKLNTKLDQELKRVSNLVHGELSNLKKFMENPAKAQEQNINARQSVIDIFKAHTQVIDLGKAHLEFKTKFIAHIDEKLVEITDLYNQKVTNQPQENLSSADILDMQKVKKIQNYIEYLNAAGEIIELIKGELEKVGVIEDRQNISKETISKYLKIERHSQNIKFYEDQIKNMLQYANEFEFYNDRKKNMTMKELQSELQTIERTFEILKQRHEFFNKYILNQKSSYDFNNISENLLRRFKILVNESKSEVEDTFKDYNNDPASKVNLLMNTFKIMKEKKFKVIAKDELEQNNQDLSKLLKISFEKIRQRCAEKMKAAREKHVEVHKEIKVNQQVKKNQIVAVQQEIQIKIQTKVNEITKSFDEKIAAEADQDKKKDHEKGKKTEINSFKNDFNTERQEKIKKIEEKFTKIIAELKESLDEPIRELAETLTLYKKAVLDINYENEKQVAQLQAVLDEIPKAGPKFIKLIEQQLDNNPKDQQSIGRVLLTTNKVFSNFVTSMINKLIRGKDIDYVLDNLQKITLKGREPMPKVHKTTIKEQFQIFKAKYEEYKALYKSNPNESTISLIATACRDLGMQLKTDFYQKDRPTKGNKIQLLSGVFALWAIQKAEKFEDEVQYTIEPHPTQITTLILLLGIAHENENINNRLAQVGTGEGKSIVLAGLSCYLALCGFKVRCACYSAYLSGRDESNFRQLFERLGIENDIKYGTFNQLCEDILNQGGSNFKGDVEKMILEKPQGWFQKLAAKFGANLVTIKKGGIKQNPTILVIDEVDVFFDDNFFGSTYCPGIKLRDSTVTRFLEYVWTQVSKSGQNIEPSTLISSQQFSQLVDRYPSLKKLLENQVHGMIAGALSYKHDYFLIDKKLVYKDNDTISPNISYGYKTVFANIHEHYKGNVTRSNLDEALQISLMVAEFSYAMLPGYFDSILGVTGTLEVLPKYKKRQLNDRYGIDDQYAIPSAFGVNKRRTDNYYIVPQDSFHQTIIAKINEVQDKRPIIVFFKGARELNEFSQSPWYESFLKRTSNLTEEHQASVRDSRIVRAVNPDTITLMTNSFGRGTDFILLDQVIKDKGGLHVIHAFLSHDQSEEVQIKGRTARQSNAGSYDCILSESWLEELSLTSGNIPRDSNSDAIHNILHKARQQKIDKLSQSTLKLLDESDKKHKDVVDIFIKESLAQIDLIEYVAKLNIYPEIRKVNIKTVLGLDATGSMGGALKKTCEIIGIAFERAYQVLNENKVKASIEIKIMVYRNYNSPFEEILETTAYENTPHNLRKFLERVGPKGGWGNEALEVFFQSLNKEDKIDQVILIGDAAPNTPNEVTSKRIGKGENYWNSNGYPATNIDKELEMFALKKSPVHSFYLNAGAAFNNISKKTGGESSPFNLNSSKVADELTAFVVENVLKLIESRVGKTGLNLVQTYRKMFT